MDLFLFPMSLFWVVFGDISILLEGLLLIDNNGGGVGFGSFQPVLIETTKE